MSILLFTENPDTGKALAGLLTDGGFSDTAVTDSREALLQALAQHQPDILVCSAPLRQGGELPLLREVGEKYPDTDVLVLVGARAYDVVTAQLTPLGVGTLSKSAQPVVFLQTLHLMQAYRFKNRRLNEQNRTLQTQITESRLIARAKLLLISQLKMTEQEAHRYIEKQAMDACCKRSEIASRIIRVYET